MSYNDEEGRYDARQKLVQGEHELKEEDIPVKSTGLMYLAILIPTLAAVAFGFSVGYTSPTLVDTAKCSDFTNGDWKTNREALNCKMGLADETKTWFGSTVNFGAAAGALIGGPVASKIGLKYGQMIGLILCAGGYLLLFLAPMPGKKDHAVDDGEYYWCNSTTVNPGHSWDWFCTYEEGSVVLLIVSRVVVGMGCGFLCCNCPPYLNEVAVTQIRGTAGACFQIGCTIGILSAYLFGLFLHFKPLALVAVIICGLCAIVLFFVLPESPRWLAERQREEDAIRSLERLRALDTMRTDESRTSLQDELHKLYRVMEADGKKGGDDGDAGGFCSGAAGKAFFIGVMLMAIQQLSGINAVMFYAGGLLDDVYPSSSSTANKWALGIQAMQVIFTITSAQFMDRMGRRMLLIISQTGMCCSTILLALFYLREKPNDGAMRACAVLGLYLFVFFFSCGLGAIPWAMMGEIFPSHIKAVASSTCTMVNWLGSFAITKTVDNLASAFGGTVHVDGVDFNKGRGWVFVLYGSICFLGLITTILIIPETKGKSLAQIQKELERPLCGGKNDDEYAEAE